MHKHIKTDQVDKPGIKIYLSEFIPSYNRKYISINEVAKLKVPSLTRKWLEIFFLLQCDKSSIW